ncbi:MAG: PEGA domain-containing protein [Acidobacteria bacterium]|nr:PEGA domain-containing protein [Acidobacteriota bacterium]
MTVRLRSITLALAGALSVAWLAPVTVSVIGADADRAIGQDRGGRRAPPPPARPAAARPARKSQVVFIGGYFYDPFFGPYPWWPRQAYPGWYFPYFDQRAELKIACRARDAAVYIDGFYAGVVDDFDGVFQSLPLPPGGHRVSLYLAGYETAEFNVYLRRGAHFTIRHEMERLQPGGESRRPALAPPVPPPPDGTYEPPRRTPPMVSTPAPLPAEGPIGEVEIRVQPATATVLIDGERWLSSEEGRYEMTLPAGLHRVDVTASGYKAFTAEVQAREGGH